MTVQPATGDEEVGRPRGRRRWRKRIWRWLVSLCALLIVAAIAGVPVYVRPQIDQLRPADAIFILGGEGWGRYPFGMGLQMQGWAPIVVLSNPLGPDDPWLFDFCKSPHANLNLQCFVPDPPTTKGEAQELRRLADSRGWHTVIAVTFRPHISRARYILEQCFDGDLIMVASPAQVSPLRWVFEYAYQTAGYVRAVLDRNC